VSAPPKLWVRSDIAAWAKSRRPRT